MLSYLTVRIFLFLPVCSEEAALTRGKGKTSLMFTIFLGSNSNLVS